MPLYDNTTLAEMLKMATERLAYLEGRVASLTQSDYALGEIERIYESRWDEPFNAWNLAAKLEIAKRAEIASESARPVAKPKGKRK